MIAAIERIHAILAVMHVARRTNQELVVVDSSIWLSVFFLCADVPVVCKSFVERTAGSLILSGIVMLFAFLFWRKEVVVFDAASQQAEWKRIRVYKLDDGIVPFSEITGIGMDSSSAKNDVPVYRLTILTSGKPVPLSDLFRGDKPRCDSVRAEILNFLHLDGGEACRVRGVHMTMRSKHC